MLSVPAPLADPSMLLELVDGEGFVYQPPAGPAFAGAGQVIELSAAGPDRFTEIAAAVEPRFFGGFAFAPGAADGDSWRSFGDAAFTLPRWLYRREGRSASLSLAVAGDELRSAGDRRLWLARLSAISAALALPPAAAPPGRLHLEPTSAASIERRIEAALDLIHAGKARKLVSALRLSALLERPDPFAVVRRLTAAVAGTGSTVFCFRRGGAVFLGATPELLIARDGKRLRSEALAGSWRHDRPLESFLASEAIAEEHGLVAAAVAAALRPCCDELVQTPPHLRHLRGLSHWSTGFEGRAEQPEHLFALAAKLHPTPAVGAYPPEASTLLDEIGEPARGWYAAPIGYCDGAGNGELWVALRSALVNGSRAEIYAGAGIVAASHPATEVGEMLAKAKTMLGALGELPELPVHPPFMGRRHTPDRRDEAADPFPGRAA